MAVVKVQCPECRSHEVVKYGRQANDEQRYRCNNVACKRRIFLLQYHNTGRLPAVKRQIVEMALNGSGIRDTARVLQISPTTVIAILKKSRPLQHVNRAAALPSVHAPSAPRQDAPPK